MASLCDQYKKVLEIITKEEGELKDDTYLDKLLDCTKENVSSTQQLHEWQILPFVRNALSEDTPEALKVFAIRLCSVILTELPDQALSLLELIPKTIYRPNQDPPMLFAVCDFLCHLFESKSEAFLLEIGELCVNVGIWGNFLRPIMVENVGKSFHLTKVIENLTVSLILVLGRALEARSSNTDVSNDVTHANFAKVIDQIMNDLWTPTDATSSFLCQVKPLLRIFQEARVDKKLLKIENAQNLTRNLMGSIKSGTLSKDLNYSEIKDILELLVYLVEDVSPIDDLSELLERILKSGNYPDSAIKAAIFVSLKHHKRFNSLGTFFLDSLHQEDKDQVVPFCIFTISVLNSLKIFKCENICAKVLHSFSKCEFDEDGKDLSDGEDVKVFRNFIVFFINCLECNSSVSSAILEHHKPMVRILQRYMGVSDGLKSDILVFLTTVLKKLEHCENMSETIQTILVHASSVSWDVRDSALICISSILSNTTLNKMLTHQDLTKIKNVLEVAKKDSNSFIRAAAFKTLTVFIENLGVDHLNQIKLIDDFKNCLDTDTEAISRREAVKLVQSFHHKLLEDGEEHENIEAVEKLMIKALFDFDWEVKVNVVIFWKSVMSLIISRNGDSNPLQSLSQHGCLTAIVIAVEDYEHLVASKARELVEMAQRFTNVEGKCSKYRKVECPLEVNKSKDNVVEEDYSSEVDDVIDDIVNRKNQDLMKDFMKEDSTKDDDKENSEGRNGAISKTTVRHISPEMFVSFLDDVDARPDDQDPPCKLASVLSDIIEAGRGTGLVEDIDCY